MTKAPKIPLADISDAVRMIVDDPTMKSVTLFCKPLAKIKKRVRITRKFFPHQNQLQEFCLSIGRPNYEEREFLALCRKAKTLPRRMMFKFFKKKK